MTALQDGAAPGPAADQGRPLRAALLIGGLTIVVLLIASALWLGIRGLEAVHSLQQARTAVASAETDYRHGDAGPGQQASAQASKESTKAHRLTDDAIWHLASHLPVVGSSLRTASGLAAAAATLSATVLPAAGDAAVKADGSSLRTADGAINLVALGQAGDELDGVQGQLASTTTNVAQLPAHPLIRAVGTARASLLTTLTSLQTEVAQIVTGSQLAVSMLGAQGPRRYLLALQNPAEIRGTGGLLGAYAIVQAEHGKVSLVQTGTDEDLKQTKAPAFDLGAGYDAQWSRFTPYTDWRQSNFSPHFPDAASIWLSLWERQTGERLDGVVAIDPEVAGAILSATGDVVTLPDGTRLNGGQVADYTESTIYAKYATDNEGRRRALVALTTAIFDQVKAGADAKAILSALAAGDGQGRVLVASAHPAEQQKLLATNVGGTLSAAAGPYQHVVVNDTAASKVDYYLDRSVSYALGACDGASRASTITVTLHNGAPVSGLPPYVSGHTNGTPGLGALYVTTYVAVGARLQSATLDGRATKLTEYPENGRPSFSGYVLLKPGATATLVLHLVEPSGGTPVTQTEQPLHRMSEVSIETTSCTAGPVKG